MQYNDFCLYYQKIVAKRTISISNVFINTINTKKKKKIRKKITKILLIYKQKLSYDILYSDCERKNFLPFTNKYGISPDLFSPLLIC